MGRSKTPKYKRILLKISGEAIQGKDSIFNLDTIRGMACEIGEVHNLGIEIGIVIGGGNIIRGEELEKNGLNRIQSDYLGMLATIINGIMFENILLSKGIPAVIQSALMVGTVTEGIVLKETLRFFEQKRVILFTGGTGNPYFTTDTAAALRASEIGADVLMKATKVDGVFDKDPAIYRGATFYKNLTYHEVIYRKLEVMDITAVSMCRDQNIPIIVFNIFQRGNIKKIALGYDIGTIIEE